jgi:hypothetical protein
MRGAAIAKMPAKSETIFDGAAATLRYTTLAIVAAS